MRKRASNYLFGLMMLFLSSVSVAAEAQANADSDGVRYQIQPGDILEISVWREPDLQRDVLIRPDGKFTFPLVGEISVHGRSLLVVRDELTKRLAKYVPDAEVTVAVKQLLGYKVYVIGQVNKPGEFLINRDVDVMQALSMAGGTTPFADLNDIKILRRSSGNQTAISFKYKEVMRGRNLEQNELLKSGDTIVVP